MGVKSLAPMLEKDFQTKFNKWVKYSIKNTAVFELKITHGKSIPFAAVQEHQEHALKLAKHKKIIFKIPDAGWQNPFDSFQIAGSESYVVVMFDNRRATKDFYMIDIDVWLNEKATSVRKSLIEERANELGTHCVLP